MQELDAMKKRIEQLESHLKLQEGSGLAAPDPAIAAAPAPLSPSPSIAVAPPNTTNVMQSESTAPEKQSPAEPFAGGTNLAPTNQKHIDRVRADAAFLGKENPAQPIPVDPVTTSASGLDPEISPAAADFQIPRVAAARGLSESAVRNLVQRYTSQRDLGLLGEPRVNVLQLNLALDDLASAR